MNPDTSSPAGSGSSNIPRRDFLKMTAATGALLAAEGVFNLWPLRAAPVPSGRNVIIFLTDQQRAMQWFPPGWAEANLTCQAALANTGVTFTNAFTNTNMCTPARTTLFTGLYPAQHLTVNTLAQGNLEAPLDHQLNPTYPNLATVMTDAGYEMAYIGKFHMSNAITNAAGVTIWDDIARYQFTQWDPPDAGRDTSIGDCGWGIADHDSRFLSDALAYITEKIENPGGKPFCLVVSLVNPHDVLTYPNTYAEAGFIPEGQPGASTDPTNTTITNGVPRIELPPTVNEQLHQNFKPVCQADYLLKCAGLGVLPTPTEKLNYLNFYAYLMKHVDSQFQQILNLLQTSPAIYSNTWVVRLADHGEYGLVHGGLRQKSFSVYDEAIRVPTIWSNPIDYPAGKGQVCDQLVSHVDFLPTLCSVLGINSNKYAFSGVNYSSLIKNPSGPAVQDYILYTYDDIWCGQALAGNPNGIVMAPNRIRAVRTKQFVYAYYFDGYGVAPANAEFYDLRPLLDGGTDYQPSTPTQIGGPLQYINYSNWAYRQGQKAPISSLLATKRTELEALLVNAVWTKLQPRPAQPAVPPDNLSVGQLNWTNDSGQLTSAIQITWLSRSSTSYQLQTSTDNNSWTNVGYPVGGNNGPMILIQPVGEMNVSYRLAWAPNPDTEQVPEPDISYILRSAAV